MIKITRKEIHDDFEEISKPEPLLSWPIIPEPLNFDGGKLAKQKWSNIKTYKERVDLAVVLIGMIVGFIGGFVCALLIYHIK